MTVLGELRVPAQSANIRIISYFIHGIGHRLFLTEKTAFDLELAVEEAVTNIINYAYADQPGDILLSAVTASEFVQITLTDWGIPLNPADVKPFDIEAPIEIRIKGGMGLHFIHTLMDQVKRTTASTPGQPNTLTLTKRIERTQPNIYLSTYLSAAEQELNAMRAISKAMASNINLDDLLSLILNQLVVIINADRGTLYLVDEERQELWSKILLEDVGPLSEIRVKIGEGIAGHVAATGTVLNIPDAYVSPYFNPEIDKTTGYHTQSILTAPMLNPQQKIIGVVQLLNKQDGPFTARDERLLAVMTSQAAIRIENTRLYQQEMQQQLINRELETANSIQESFLPDVIPQYAGWDIGALWCPIRNVAGDFYDFYHLEDGRLAAVIADVSGKGIPAALFMSLSVTVLRFGMSLNLPPDEVMRRANKLIIANQRSRMFATTFITYISPKTGDMLFSSGGHNPPILFRAATQRCEYITAPGVAIGLFSNAEFAANATSLAAGDILVLYTDGITEVLNNHEDEFGEERLEELITHHAQHSAQAIADLILVAINDFAEDQHLFDDATLVVIKRTHIPGD